MRLHWINSVSQNLKIEETEWNPEYDKYPSFVAFLRGDYCRGYAAADELLSEGTLISILSDDHFLLISYELLANIDDDTPMYVIAMIVRRFLQIYSTGRLALLPRFITEDVKAMLIAAVEMGWSDKRRIERLKAQVMLW